MFHQRAPFDTTQTLLVFTPMKLIADALSFFLLDKDKEKVTIVHSLGDPPHRFHDVVLVMDTKKNVKESWKQLYTSIPLCATARSVYLYSV